MSILIKSGRRIRDYVVLLICTLLAGGIVWRGLMIDDSLTFGMCTALGISLVFTGIALADYRKSTLASDNGS